MTAVLPQRTDPVPAADESSPVEWPLPVQYIARRRYAISDELLWHTDPNSQENDDLMKEHANLSVISRVLRLEPLVRAALNHRARNGGWPW
jgi:hypothetical protein